MKAMRYLWPFLPTGALFVACVHTLGYWGKFHINAFEFLTVNQMLLTSAKALIWMPLIVILGAALGTEMALETKELQLRGSKTRARAQDAVIYGLFLGSMIAGSYALVIESSMWAILFAPAVGITIGHGVASQDWVPSEVATPRVVYTVSFFASMLVITAYGYGQMAAQDVLDGTSYLALADEPCAERFVGRAGEFMFFYNPNNHAVRLETISNSGGITLLRRQAAPCVAP